MTGVAQGDGNPTGTMEVDESNDDDHDHDQSDLSAVFD